LRAATHAPRSRRSRSTPRGTGCRIRYASDVVEVVETWLYRPVIRLFGVAVAYAKRLQSGRLDAYLLYMLIALVAVTAVVTALA
jgi:hydrogenase-4 component B